ncbi:mechanosensitive ion channel family protein [Paenibacillus xerothermodurans]|uniref:Mechanosensitive ion channel family protein n=1 Tax=Paenibacillus xerothermodurans TaxID=1977292 RepID=A0A2W1P1H0_PAEXE|nr:mechanosensitive ion channel family protein [Paenibacillus xerothermodurans]PZE21592.1 mechanosensitive ion channel family protein [Paenibacillus xerothermodurans]
MMVEWLMQFYDRVRWTDLFISVGIMLIFLLFRKLFTRYVIALIVDKFSKSKHVVLWATAFEKPIRGLFVLVGAYLAITYFMPPQWWAMVYVDRICRSLGIIFAGWGIYNVSAASSALLEGISKRFGLDDSSMMIPFLSKALRFIIIVLIITAVGSEWGFSVNGLVAGMGLGSLAIALAAKDTLGNILGGIVIILEKPFSKGDWIMTPSAEGIVEDITFRSTTIRTFADSIVTVPNATLADHAITNWSKMGKRRISFTLGVALNTERDRLANAVERLELMLNLHDKVDQDTVLVKFNEFNENHLGILFYFFTKTTVWSEHLAVHQEINLAILEILEEEGVELAYHSQRILVEEAGFNQVKRYSQV